MIVPKNSRAAQAIRLDLHSLLLQNGVPDASQVRLQLTDLHVTTTNPHHPHWPLLLLLPSASAVVRIEETVQIRATIAPIDLQLNTAQYVDSDVTSGRNSN